MIKKYIVSFLLSVSFCYAMDREIDGMHFGSIGTQFDDASCTSPLTVSSALTPITPEREKKLRSGSVVNLDNVIELIEQDGDCAVDVEKTLPESLVQISPYREDMVRGRQRNFLVKDALDGIYYDKNLVCTSDLGGYLNKPSVYRDKKKACFQIEEVVRRSVGCYARPFTAQDITKIIVTSAVFGDQQVPCLESLYKKLVVDQGTPAMLGVSMTGHLAPLRKAINEIKNKK